MSPNDPTGAISVLGTTRIIAVIADPVDHLITPRVMNALMARRGEAVISVPLHVKPEGLAIAVQGLAACHNVIGAVITLPHKIAAAALCDELGEEASRVRTVNALRWTAERALQGDLFDGLGMVRGLLAEGIDPRMFDVHLIGAGGAARAIAFAVARHGCRSLTISNRNRESALALASEVNAACPATSVAAGEPRAGIATLVINATSLGLSANDPLPMNPDVLAPGSVAADVVMKPARTAFLIAAEQAGIRTHGGRHMLAGQIEEMADWFLAAAPATPLHA